MIVPKADPSVDMKYSFPADWTCPTDTVRQQTNRIGRNHAGYKGRQGKEERRSDEGAIARIRNQIGEKLKDRFANQHDGQTGKTFSQKHASKHADRWALG